MLLSRPLLKRFARSTTGALSLLLLAGCETSNYVSLFPSGTVGEQERDLIIISFLLMMFVFVPVVILTLWFMWHYRVDNHKATYKPRWDHSSLLEVFLWGGPVVIIAILGVLTWYSTHALDPYKEIASKHDTVHVQGIAMDWKWLFIYPDRNIATVDELAIPKNRPVSIDLTSDTVMNAFMVPALGTQIFAMSGMRTNVNLMSNETGKFFGKNYQYTGEGFHNMAFQVNAMEPAKFEDWASSVKQTGAQLDADRFAELTKPSDHAGVTYFAPVKDDLFGYVIGLYNNGTPRNETTKTASTKVGPSQHGVTD